MSRQAVGHTRVPILWVPVLFLGWYSSMGVKLTSYLPVALRFKMNGSVPLLPDILYHAYKENFTFCLSSILNVVQIDDDKLLSV
jgi:hypothetical protein